MNLPRPVLFCLGLLLMSACGHGAKAPLVITDFGAVAGGTALNTAAIQAAIDAAAARGAGTVVIPAGVFRSGSIFLKQGVALHLAAGAVLKGSENIADYPKQPTRIEGHFESWRVALVNASGLTGLRISGPGKLDGSGPVFWRAFWQRRKENPQCTNLEVERPRLMFIDRCTNVRITNIALEDSGFWNLHLYRCRDVLIEGVRITIPGASAELRGPSTDGIDVDSSQKVTIRKCYISSNDDDIALKGSKGPLADHDADSPPVEDILVEDCEIGDGNGLITCGSEATVVRRVTARNCVMSGRATVLTLKLRPDTPQHYEDITIENIKLAGGGRLLNVAPWTQFFDLKGLPAPARTVNNVTLRNITGSYHALGTLRGNAGDTLRDITLENIAVKLADETFAPGPVQNLVLKNVVVNGRPIETPMPAAKP
ncbi:MAG: glycosyl hydrolase family 28 protein [bacterium]|nr:glycosyl hydrolase family 28 protein [bacterium]MDI1335398.1 glycosyl hydrolase family 28 protein [Lacunisphaera sp.]